MSNIYDLLVIGGGISSCTFISDIFRKGFNGRVALLEAGRGLGGRSSTRYSSLKKEWVLNHGCPNFNIVNETKILKLDLFIEKLLDKNIIKNDNSLILELDNNYKFSKFISNDFYKGYVYSSVNSMSEFVSNILNLHNNKNKIDLIFNTLVNKLTFIDDKWIISTLDKRNYKAKFLVISSNLLLHNRSKNILNVNEVPLRKSIPIGLNNQIDEIINQVENQKFIKRINYLIKTKDDYKFKNSSDIKDIHILFNKKTQMDIGFERIIFQKQKNNKIGIVIHTRNFTFKRNDKEVENKSCLYEILLSRFNEIFINNEFINQIFDYEDISCMKWRSSQPLGKELPPELQLCKEFKIGFCGDWISCNSFGKVEGAILSGLNLSEKFENVLL